MSTPVRMNLDDHLGEVYQAALVMAPAFRERFDFSDKGERGPSHAEQLATLAWEAGSALVRKYHTEVDAAGEREAKANPVRTSKPSDEVQHA